MHPHHLSAESSRVVTEQLVARAEVSDAPETVNRSDIRKTRINPDFWYPVARSKAVKKGKAHPTSFAGEPIVLVRTKEGDVFAVEDRCAHRQIPLHLGVVEDDCLKCAYHGWKYDRT